MKVKITTGRAWYEDMVGEVIEVVEWGGDYVIKEDYDRGHELIWRYIDLDDAEVIDEN